MINNEEWELYEEKYGKLMHTISMKISGDPAICSHEDNYAELCGEAIRSIIGYHKKTGQSFKEAFGTKLFDQYTKTCLWNYKNNKGAGVTRKKPITQCVSVSDNEEILQLPDTSANSIPYDFKDYLSDEQAKVVNTAVRDYKVFKENGRLCVAEIARQLGWTHHHTTKVVSQLSKRLKNEL